MAIPFRDVAEEESLGAAGYLKFLPQVGGDTWLAALFLMDDRGEPVEFSHARLRAPSSFLWRPDDLRTHCLRSLCCALFDACPTEPLLMLCLADEVGPHLFSEHVSVNVPVGRLCAADAVVSVAPSEAAENAAPTNDQTGLSIYWTGPPDAESPARRLFDALAARGLLLEPFSRAEAGLHEVYADVFPQ